jgi:hypothetical protein
MWMEGKEGRAQEEKKQKIQEKIERRELGQGTRASFATDRTR